MAYFDFPHTRTYDSDLGWLIQEMKRVINNVEAQDALIQQYKEWTEQHVADVEQVAADLTAFVNNYFDNLDVQQEINNKINDMAQDGSLLQLLEVPVTEIVGDWLSDHLTPTSPPVDNTLSVSGAAADAKVTGDRITELNSDLKSQIEQQRSETTTNDILITDESGFIGARIKKGFNSSDVLQKDDVPDWIADGASAISVTDKSGNIVVSVGNMQPRFVSNLTGMRISVLGDSISTYDAVGYKMPAIESDHTQFYPRYNVRSIDQMWYGIVCNTLGTTMLKSASWGGSMVSGTGSVDDGKPGWSDARIAALADGSTVPDIVLVEMGTNDFETGKTLGNFDGSSTLPITIQTGGTFSDAYALMISKIRAAYPMARIICMTILARKSVNDVSTISSPEYPVTNSQGLCIDDYNNVIRNIAHYMNCSIADTYACGINPWNIPLIESGASYGTILGDRFVHPNAAGMRMIAETVVNTLRQM